MNTRAWKWANLVIFIATIGMNAAAVTLPLAGRKTQDVSAMFEHLFTPANFTFSIWSVIYTLLFINAIDSLRRSDNEDVRFTQARVALIGANILNFVWLVFWHNLLLGLAFPTMLGILGCLIYAFVKFEPVKLSGWAAFTQRAPIAAYLGWISVATIANAGNTLVWLGVSGGLEPSAWAMLLALVAAGIAAFLARFHGGAAFCATLAWGLWGVISRPSDGLALLGLYIGLGLIAFAVSSRWWLKPQLRAA